MWLTILFGDVALICLTRPVVQFRHVRHVLFNAKRLVIIFFILNARTTSKVILERNTIHRITSSLMYGFDTLHLMLQEDLKDVKANEPGRQN